MKKCIISLILIILAGYSASTQDTIFQKTYGISGMDLFADVQQTTDGGFIMAGTNTGFLLTDFSLIKTDPYGYVTWSRTFGDGDFTALFSTFFVYDVQQTTDGGYIVTGEGISTPLFGSGFDDIFLIKTDAFGVVQWNKKYGGSDSDCGMALKQTSDGGYIVTGCTYSFSSKDSANVFLMKVNSSGSVVWDRIYEISPVDDDIGVSVEEVSDGYIVGGRSEQVNGTDTLSDMLLLKTNLSGTFQWLKTIGNNNQDEEIFGIKKMITGSDLLVTGFTDQPSDIRNVLIMKINPSTGAIISCTSYYTGWLSFDDEGHTIQETPDGGMAVFGMSFDLLGFLRSFMMKFDNTGTPELSRHFSTDWGIGMNLFSCGQQTNEGEYIIGNMVPSGIMGWSYGLIKTDENGISGCNEGSFSPVEQSFTITPVNESYSVLTNQFTAENFSLYENNVDVIPEVQCCSWVPDDAGAITGPTTVCQGDSWSYSVPSISTTGTTYVWEFPSGVSISSGAGTNNVTLNFSATAVSGYVQVHGEN
ncbi:MAG: hypothetical protein KJ607_07085 [Bacteroidetes bacterium]|nr:hypothetical protein [Bacteroidota bacterium]